MCKKQVLDWLSSDNGLFPTKAVKQHWQKANFSYMKTPRPDFGLMVLTKGEIDFLYEEGMVSSKEGDVVFLPKNCHYDARMYVERGNVDTYLINFDSEKCDVNWSHPIKLFEGASFSCTESFKKLVEENLSVRYSVLRAKGLFYLLLDAVVRERDGASAAQLQIFIKAQDLLSRDDMTVRDIARECCISESGLRRLFRESTGVSPARYRIDVKINQAIYLLEATDMSVNEISDALNFYDAAYFCKVFLARVGVTPKQYAQNKKL